MMSTSPATAQSTLGSARDGLQRKALHDFKLAVHDAEHLLRPTAEW
jgi:hypothetical protein